MVNSVTSTASYTNYFDWLFTNFYKEEARPEFINQRGLLLPCNWAEPLWLSLSKQLGRTNKDVEALQDEVKILGNRLKATGENATRDALQLNSLQKDNDDLEQSVVFAEEMIGKLRNEVKDLKDQLLEKQTTARRRSRSIDL